MISNKLIAIFILCMIPALLFPQQNRSSMLLKTHETAGIYLQAQAIAPGKGNTQFYNLLSIPVQIRYESNRYFSLTFRLNQGSQSYGGTGLYSLGDLEVDARYLQGENLTFVGGVRLPTGTKALDYDQLIATSAGRLPFINAPVICGASGFGMHVGLSYGQQPNEKTAVAIGVLYTQRDEYTPIKDGGKYDPTDAFMVAGGIEYKDGQEWGFMCDVQFIKYSKEKMDGEELSDPGRGVALSGKFFLRQLELRTLYYYRDESHRKNAGDFIPPSVLNLKLGHRGVRPFIPYIGLTLTSQGTLVEAASLFLAGFYFEKFKLGDYPMNPYIEVNFGTIGSKTKTFGIKIGTDVSFQIY
jgi:hypothetical protein